MPGVLFELEPDFFNSKSLSRPIEMIWSEISGGLFWVMTKEQLIKIIEKLLETDAELDFLSKMTNSELETLVAVVRNRVENFGESWHHLIMTNACKRNPSTFSGYIL